MFGVTSSKLLSNSRIDFRVTYLGTALVGSCSYTSYTSKSFKTSLTSFHQVDWELKKKEDLSKIFLVLLKYQKYHKIFSEED